MLESEAKTKWCPMARSSKPGNHNRHSDGNGRTDCLCLGSGCMMWVSESPAGLKNEACGRCGLAR